jgi:predicted 3-demethylubiquinone-9 3-methyltransferase (glyoxalase superfamily)
VVGESPPPLATATKEDANHGQLFVRRLPLHITRYTLNITRFTIFILMNTTTYPCLWFDNNAGEAVDHYFSVFGPGEILQHSPLVITAAIRGTKMMFLNGGPMYRPTPAASYFVYCGGVAEIDRIYAALADGGTVRMPLGEYPWTSRYAWVQDKFGVDWQLDVDDIRSTQKIAPALLFANEKSGLVKSAMERYIATFPDSRILLEAPYPDAAEMPAGTLLFAQFRLRDMIVNAMSSSIPHDFDFSPGNSFVVSCEDQAEIDHYWDVLGEGGRQGRCGWVQDAYGVSWQVVPAILGDLMADPQRGPRVVAAFLRMDKFDLAALLNA